MIQLYPKEIRRIFASGKSLWRAYLNTCVQQLRLESPVLDLGAGAVGSASYHHLIPNFATLEVCSVDLDNSKQPTKTANIEQGIPYEDGKFKSCVAFNLFEHLYEYRGVMQEAYRVLSPGGTLYIGVPFLVRVHADPYDYFRYTAYTLERSLKAAGFADIEITACGGGAVTGALAQLDFAVPRLLRGMALQIAFATDERISARSGGKYRTAQDYPIGYFVATRKALLTAGDDHPANNE